MANPPLPAVVLTASDKTVISYRCAQAAANNDVLGSARKLDQFMENVKLWPPARLDGFVQDTEKELKKAQDTLRSLFRDDVFKALGYSMPPGPVSSRTYTPSARIPSDIEFVKLHGDLVESAKNDGRSAHNGSVRFANVTVGAPGKVESGTELEFHRAADMVQLVLSQACALNLHWLGVDNPGITGLDMRDALKTVTLLTAQLNAIATLRMHRGLRQSLDSPAAMANALNLEYPAQTLEWTVSDEGLESSYTHPGFPDDFKLLDQLPPLCIEFYPGWYIKTKDVFGWDTSLCVQLVHLLDNDHLELIARRVYQSVNPFVTAQHIPDFLHVNRFGSQLFPPHEVLSGRMETSVSVLIGSDGSASRGAPDEAFHAARILKVLTIADRRLKASIVTQRFASLTINICMTVPTTQSVWRIHDESTVGGLLPELVAILAEINETWKDEFPDWAEIARQYVRIRFWPVCENFNDLVSPNGSWLPDVIRWERLPALVAGMPYSANKRLAQQWLSSAIIHPVADWDQILSGPGRALIQSQIALLPRL